MERRRFGATGMDVSLLGFGGAEIGYMEVAQDEVERLLGAALDAGLNVIDTAECYRDSETKIGEAVGHRRDDFWLFTKTGHAAGLDGDDWDPAMMARGIDRSLQRLKTDRVDLILLHSCSLEKLQKGDVIDVLVRAREQGKTRFIGYSGDHTAARWAVESGVFDALETSVSIADQEAIDLTLPIAEEKGLGVIAKRPIANAVWRTGQKPESEYHQPYWERLQELRYGFLEGDVQEGVRHALRFTATAPAVHTMIVGTTKPERWSQNAALLEDGPLEAEQYEAIRERWREVAKPDWVGQI